MELHRFSEVRADGKPYIEFLRTGKLSAGVYRLAAGAADPQQPHGEEEIYYVVSGHARFRGGERDVAVAPGNILFVPALEAHQFYEIKDELEVLVFFAPPERTKML
ncbi:MAG: cupin domain-containing protein [Acidobacteria bacterium]|nr:cupin domain-containing protein [Acidobacteriota bacterium]